jgi:hypothetical protein
MSACNFAIMTIQNKLLDSQKKWGTMESHMRCSVCDSLQREHSLMNQIEATTVLQKRHRFLHPLLENESADQNPDQVLDEIVLFSRKRQAQIAFRLQRHQDRVHAA